MQSHFPIFLILVTFAVPAIVGLQSPLPFNRPHLTTSLKMPDANNNALKNAEQLHAMVEKDGKGMEAIPFPVFLLMSIVVLPLWATILLPLTISFQLSKPLFRSIEALFTKNHDKPGIVLDTGYVVDKKDILPRAERKYDVVLLGATGFTGKLMCRHMIKTYGCGSATSFKGEKATPLVTWAIAGRNQRKLDSIKESLAKELDCPEALDIDTIIVDTAIPDNLPGLVKDTRVVRSNCFNGRDHAS